MDIRLEPLTYESEYFLDGASQSREISGAADIALRLYGDVGRIDRIISSVEVEVMTPDDVAAGVQPPPRRYSLRDRYRRALELERYAGEIIAELPRMRQSSFKVYALHSGLLDMAEKADFLASSNFEDSTRGGCLESFRDVVRLTRDMRPTPRVARRLTSGSAIRRYVKQHVRCDISFAHSINIFGTAMKNPGDLSSTQEDRAQILADLRWQSEQIRLRALGRMSIQQWEARRFGMVPQITKKKRGPLKRAVQTAVAVAGRDVVSSFLRGDTVMFRGGQFQISAALRGSVAKEGHGALEVGLHDMDGRRMASLCVYQKLPALDQLVSLALHVQAGEEMEVVETGNLYAVDAGSMNHPVIAGKKSAVAEPAEVQRLHTMFSHFDRGYELFNRWRNEYVKLTQPIYREALAVSMFGIKARALVPAMPDT